VPEKTGSPPRTAGSMEMLFATGPTYHLGTTPAIPDSDPPRLLALPTASGDGKMTEYPSTRIPKEGRIPKPEDSRIG
jgi:hypothetical protein